MSVNLAVKALCGSPYPQEDEIRPAGAPKEGCKELCPAVRRADLRPLPEAAGKVLELWRSLPRLQPPHLQQVSCGSSDLEVHGLPRIQVGRPPASLLYRGLKCVTQRGSNQALNDCACVKPSSDWLKVTVTEAQISHFHFYSVCVLLRELVVVLNYPMKWLNSPWEIRKWH